MLHHLFKRITFKSSLPCSTTTATCQLQPPHSRWLRRLLAGFIALLAIGIANCSLATGFFHAPKHPFYLSGGIGMGSLYWNRVEGVDDGKTIRIDSKLAEAHGIPAFAEGIAPAVFIGAPSKAGGYGFAYSFSTGYYVNAHFAIQFDYTRLPTTQVVLPKSATLRPHDPRIEAAAKRIENFLGLTPEEFYADVATHINKIAGLHITGAQVGDLIENGTIPSAYPQCRDHGCTFNSRAYAFDLVAKFITPIMHSRYSAFASIGPSWTFRHDSDSRFAHRHHHLGAAFGAGFGASIVPQRLFMTLEYDYRTGSEKSSLTPVYDYLPYNASLMATTGFRF